VLTMDGEEYLTVDEACALLGVKRTTLYSYVTRRRLRSYKQGIRRQRLYRRADLDALLAIRPADQDAPGDAPSQQ
jgi:excisionase family DNA binding protein